MLETFFSTSQTGAADGSGPGHKGWPARWSWLILSCIALLYIGTSVAPSIFDDNEGLYAGAVREMHQSGNWLVPTSNGFPRVQKPPLVYWTMLVSTSLLGENEFALRLPNALATIVWIMATYVIARRMGGERAGLAAALVLSSMLGVWVFNHLVQPEPFLACFISLAFWCLVEARCSTVPPEQNSRPYLFFWIFLALGSMSKGLHGALWPLATASICAVFVRSWRPWLRPIVSVKGVTIFAVMVVPWYTYMSWRFPGFLHAHFINEQVGATLNTRYPADTKQLPVWQFYAQHFLFWLLWTLLLPASIYAWVQKKHEVQLAQLAPSLAGQDIAKLLGVWLAVVFFTVAFSTRQDYYAMNCWGVVAIFLAMPWTVGTRSSTLRMFIFIPCLLIAFAGVAALGLASWTHYHLAASDAGTASPIQTRDTFMDALAGISPALWERFLTLLWIFGGVALLSGMVAARLVWQMRFIPALLVLSAGGFVPMILGTIGFSIMAPYFSLEENALSINRQLTHQPNAIVACEALPNTASSLFYYLNARVHWVNAPFNDQYAQQVLGLGRDYYLDEQGLLRLWRSGVPVYLIVEEDRLSYWETRLVGFRILNKSGTRLVLANRGV